MLSTFKTLFLLILIIFSHSLLAKINNIDFIEKQLLQETGEKRLHLLAQLTEYYFEENPTKAKTYGEEALRLLNNFPNNKLQLSIGHHLFDAYRDLSELEKAESLAYKNFEQAEKYGDLREKANAHIDLSNILSHKNSDYKGAIKHLNIACSQLTQLNDFHDLGSCFNNTGLAYYYDTNYEEALRYYLKALEISTYRSQIAAAHTLGNIALINMQYGRWEDALIYYHQALDHAKSFDKKSMISEQLINIGVAYLFNDELDKSIEYLNKAKVLEKEIGNVRSLFRITKRLGEAYVEKKKFAAAIAYYQEASRLSDQMLSDNSYIEITMALGVLNAKLEKFDTALVLFNNALQRAEKTKRKPFIYEAHENLYKTNKDLGNFKTSLFHHEIYYQLKSEKIEASRVTKISELEEKYNAQQRDSQIALLTKDKKLKDLRVKQLQYYTIAVITLITLFAGFFFYRQKQKVMFESERAILMSNLVKKKNQLLADVSHELATPLTVLKLQVESLKDDLEEDVQVTYNALDNKLTDLEYLIGDIHQLAMSDIGALQLKLMELDITETLNFWQTELVNSVGNKALDFTFNNQLPEKLIVKVDIERLKQICINLLTNSVKYTHTPGKILLTAKTHTDHLYLSIEDSAPCVPEAELGHIFERLYRVEQSRSRETGGSGLGLAICKSLITAHGGEIHAEMSTLGGLKVIIKLPI